MLQCKIEKPEVKCLPNCDTDSVPNQIAASIFVIVIQYNIQLNKFIQIIYNNESI